ncbi:MAG: LysM peptidoglycan-binding domain-containing protein [Flavobacterium sp.]|nr:LysM peptidoglycan-binding domain-containing protein [Flavobacterium sp.]
MRFLQIIILFILLSTTQTFAQKVIKHAVKSGESIYLLAKKYNTTEAAIFEANPKLKGKILALKTVVEIPNKDYKIKDKTNKKQSNTKKDSKPTKDKKEQVAKSDDKDSVPIKVISNNFTDDFETHTVLKKETLYSLSKKYNVTMETICELNPELKTGNLKVGSKLKLTKVKQENSNENKEQSSQAFHQIENKLSENRGTIIHKVEPKETLFKISRQFNVSVSDLKRLNPSIISDLPVGYNLIIQEGIPDKTETQNTTANTSNDSIEEVINVKPLSRENLSKADFLIAKASENLGIHYRSGGTTRAGFDCSGLMFNTFKNIDLTLPRSSHEMSNFGTRIDKSQAQKGDLIFFGTHGRGNVNHVGMITEVLDDEIKFIHSSIQAGVIISSTKEPYYTSRFIQINRILKD